MNNAGYFVGYYNIHRKKYNKKGHWYTVKIKKKNRKFKVYFHDFDEYYKEKKNLQYSKLTKDVLGTLRIVGGKEIIPSQDIITKAFGRGEKYLPNAFYGTILIEITLMKDGNIGVYKKNTFLSHVSYGKYKLSMRQYFGIAYSHGSVINSKILKYPKIEPREKSYKTSICPQITPPKKYQNPMLNAKIKPYKNLAGNRIE